MPSYGATPLSNNVNGSNNVKLNVTPPNSTVQEPISRPNPPRIIERLTDHTVDQGEPITLHCKSEGTFFLYENLYLYVPDEFKYSLVVNRTSKGAKKSTFDSANFDLELDCN